MNNLIEQILAANFVKVNGHELYSEIEVINYELAFSCEDHIYILQYNIPFNNFLSAEVERNTIIVNDYSGCSVLFELFDYTPKIVEIPA